MELFDEQNIAEYNGRDNKPTYIVYKGRVYDVTASKLWRDGFHMKRHHAGQDLTDFFPAAPHGEEVFSRYPQVGEFRAQDQPSLPDFLTGLLERFPILRRHPHPITVHFPIVFFSVVLIFDLLYVFTGRTSFYDASLYCIYGGFLMMPPAMMTGFFAWWINYQAKAMQAVARKIQLASLLLVLSAGALFWRSQGIDLLSPFRIESLLYLSLIIAFWPLVIALGYTGGSLVFPHSNDKSP
jgi:predicted heme/steroid binding protein/uncharacterized membrane protein